MAFNPFDIFTGAPAIEAAEKNRGNLQKTQADIFSRTWDGKNEAQGYINTGYGGARTNLGQGYGASTGAINVGADDALGYLDAGAGGAMGKLDLAKLALTKDGGAFTPLSELAGRFGAGSKLYADALGLGGAEGTGRARAAYSTSPGFEATRDAGIDAINRRANAGGMLVGGNANRDAITFAHDLANKDYGSWLDRLGQFDDLELAATSGAATGNAGVNRDVAGIDTTAASLLDSSGRAKAGVTTGRATSLADLARQYYAQQAGNDVGQYNALAGNVTGAVNSLNQSDLNIAPKVGQTFTDEAQASLTGTKNLWNLGMQGATALAGGFGGGAGGSSFLPSSSFMKNSWGW